MESPDRHTAIARLIVPAFVCISGARVAHDLWPGQRNAGITDSKYRSVYFLAWLPVVILLCVRAQDVRVSISRSGGAKPTIAIPDLRCAGDAQQYMAVVNRVLWDDMAGSGAALRMMILDGCR